MKNSNCDSNRPISSYMADTPKIDELTNRYSKESDRLSQFIIKA